jgi:predicted RNA binding protein YcfA (HicA-like mRNA interferase family)
MNSFTPAIREILKRNGFVWFRTGKGDHEIWIHATTGRRVTVDAKVKSRHLANKILVHDAGLPKAF